MATLTTSERKALQWLWERLGDGVYAGKGGTLLAMGQIAPFYRTTYDHLCAKGMCERYGNKRIKLTLNGYEQMQGLS